MDAAAAAMHLPSGGGGDATIDQSASIKIASHSSSSSSSSPPSLLSRAATFARTLARKAAVSVRLLRDWRRRRIFTHTQRVKERTRRIKKKKKKATGLSLARFSLSLAQPRPHLSLSLSPHTPFTPQVLTAGPLPSHVAFIMDGNRRFAESHLGTQDASEGHAAGYAALLSALEWCLDLGVRTVSVFAFSVDNFSRPRAEVDALMELAREKLGELAGNGNRNSGGTAATAATTAAETRKEKIEEDEKDVDGGALLQRHGVQLRVLGELSLLPAAVAEAARAAEKATRGGDRARLNVCLAYSSTRELAGAVSSELSSSKEENGEVIPGLSSSIASPPAPAPASPTTPLVEAGASSAVVAASLGGEQGQQQLRVSSSLTPSPSQSPLPAETAAAAAAAAETSSSPSPLYPTTANLIDRALYTAGCPPVDLLLRTSGESRLSDFLLWQSRHAALVFAPRLWPELRFLDVARAVVAFQRASPRLGELRRAAAAAEGEGRRRAEEVAEEATAAAATVSRADDDAAAAATAPAPAPAPAAAAAAPPPAPAAPPPPPRGGGGGGGVPRRVRGSRTAGARAQAFPSFSEGGAGGGEAEATTAAATAATAGEAPPEASGERGGNEAETDSDVLGWASRSTWRRIKRRGDAEIEDEEGLGTTGGPDDHGFDPHCPCCLTTGGRLIDGAADEPRNLKMPDGLEEAMLAKKRREAEVRAEMAAARAARERERKAKEEEEKAAG